MRIKLVKRKKKFNKRSKKRTKLNVPGSWDKIIFKHD